MLKGKEKKSKNRVLTQRTTGNWRVNDYGGEGGFRVKPLSWLSNTECSAIKAYTHHTTHTHTPQKGNRLSRFCLYIYGPLYICNNNKTKKRPLIWEIGVMEGSRGRDVENIGWRKRLLQMIWLYFNLKYIKFKKGTLLNWKMTKSKSTKI